MSDLRDMLPTDRGFVVDSWAKSARRKWKALTKDERYARAARLVDASRVVVLGGANGVVHAWAAASDGKLLYVYVAKKLRGFGLARKVTDAALSGARKEAA